jgi:hypothetical protein
MVEIIVFDITIPNPDFNIGLKWTGVDLNEAEF